MMRSRQLALLSIAALELAPACARDGDASSSFTSGPHPATSAAETMSAGSSHTIMSSSSGSSVGDASGEASTSTTAASTGAGDETTIPPDFDPYPVGCQGKIDFLFVIDSHFEVKQFQLQLEAAFPAFVDTLEQDLAEFDYQIMVVDAGTYPIMYETCWDCYMCDSCNGCADFGGPEDYPCDEPLVDCDVLDGAGVTITGNFGASNKRCEMATENRYITRADADTLQESFKCIATLGEGPKTPVAMEAMTAALEPDMLSGGCNDGFVRPDALLVVVVIQGGQDNGSPGTPQSWYDTLVTVKGGNEEAVVVLVVSDDTEAPDGWCDFESNGPNPLRIFAETAAHGQFESICAPSYIPFLQKGAMLALDQCSLLIPQ